MLEDSFNKSSDYSAAEVPTLYYGGDGVQTVQRTKTHDQQQSQQQQHQEELRHSNRDSGISSEKQKQQLPQQQQPKISQHMSRFLSDTMKSSQSFEKDQTRSDDQRNAMDCSMNIDGKVLNKKAQKYVELADDWEQRKVLKENHRQKGHHQSSPPISSLPPTSNMQEAARGEINPTRFSDRRLTPEIEILNDNEKRQNRQQQPSKYENVIPRKTYEERKTNYSNQHHHSRRASETRRPSESHQKYQLNVRPLSRPNSRQHRHDYSSCDSCTSPRKCCHHTYYYVCNHPPDRYYSENHYDRHRSYKPTIKSMDDMVLKNLALMKAECNQIKRMSKASRRYDNDDNLLPRYDRRFDKKTVEFGSFDSGIEEPFEKQKIEIPSLITSHTIMVLLNFNKKYEFLTNMARNILIQRKNVRNFVAEFEAALNRHSDLLKRYINRLELQLSEADSSKYSKLEKEIAEARKNLFICEEKAKEFEAAIQRDRITYQKLPERNGSRATPDLDYQRRMIYEIFMS